MPVTRVLWSRRLALFAAVTLALGGLGWLWLRASLPRTAGRVSVRGLHASATITRDRDGVPHILAATDADALFALGYAHAQDRLWQMEFQRRVAAGRLSEVLGESTLNTDRYLRTLGLHRAAATAYKALDEDSRSLLRAYAAGVNGFLAEGGRLPPEFVILQTRPEPWRPEDSLGWIKMMSQDLAGDYETELLRGRLLALLGPERMADLLPDYVAGALPSVPGSGGPAGSAAPSPAPVLDAPTADGLLAMGEDLRSRFSLMLPGGGSNSWVVSGRLAAGGKPLLANDPHLSARIPSVWYLAELHGDRIHAVGSTLPGVPGIVIGRNAHIAWGLTSLVADTQDLYLERLDPDRGRRYQTEAGWQDLTLIDEPIRVKGRQRPEPWVARLTRHGPLISDVLADAAQPMALRWTALDDDDSSFAALIAIDRAAGRADFQAALARFVTPPQNFAYADDAGHIGLIGAGRIPLRPAGLHGELPRPGWDGAAEWTGFVPFESLPQAWDPDQGWLANANQLLVGSSYPFHLSNQWSPPYRMTRISGRLNELSERGDITLDDLQALQLDRRSLPIATFAAAALKLGVPAASGGLDLVLNALLAAADGTVERDSRGAALLEVWFAAFARAALVDEFGEELARTVIAERHPQLVERMLAGDAGAALWCDDRRTMGLESCADLFKASLGDALERVGLPRERPDDAPASAAATWGDLHHSQYPHNPFSEVPLLRPLFHRSIANGGDSYTVNVGNVDPESLDQRNVPSYRQLIDFGRPDTDRFMHTTGQSGNLLSDHYDDLIERHRDGQYLTMRLDRTPPLGRALVLEPLP